MYLSWLTTLGALSLSSHINSIQAYNTGFLSNDALAAISNAKNIVSLKNLVIANHEFEVLPQIYTKDIILEAPAWDLNVQGIADVIQYLKDNDGKHVMMLLNNARYGELVNPTTIKLLSNVQEIVFGQGDKAGKAESYYMRFDDKLTKTEDGWRVYHTVITNVGGPIGDLSIAQVAHVPATNCAMRGSARFREQL
ncbi:MAG: hypothetical protein M1835_008145 [Candelina submexicana]|nr:MAG: hypothetical protein M1835_008145 [Candelina submexicana]